jgi:inosose dehydratase
MVIGTGSFRWLQRYRMQGLSLEDHLEETIAEAARAGMKTWEPIGLPTDEYTTRLQKTLTANGMKLTSLYVNCRLHDEEWPESVEAVMQQALRAKALGATIICTNPEPLNWNEPLDKTDDQLSIQLGAMFTLCQRLQTEGMELAYHVHSSELRNKGREFLFMMENIPAPLMGFCLDTHWIYRGYGNSQRAVNDAITKYGPRVLSLHLRQSQKGIWTETLCDGDVDYAPLAKWIKNSGFDGPLYIELGYEEGVPQTMSLQEAHRQSLAWVQKKIMT